jgi:hypothetical protein
MTTGIVLVNGVTIVSVAGASGPPGPTGSTVTGTVTLEQYGAIGNGVASDQIAFAAALGALAAATVTGTGPNAIILGANRTYLVTGGTLPAGCAIIGQGESSILKTATNAPVIVIGGQGCLCANFQLFALLQGGFTSMTGIQNGQVGVASSGFENFRCEGVYFNQFWTGLQLSQFLLLAHKGPRVVDCWAFQCVVGYFIDTLAEYCQFSNCQTYQCTTGMTVNGGNNVFANCCLNGNLTTGLQLGTGTNDGHGMFVGGSINHSGSVAIAAGALVNGMPFVGVDIYGGNINLTSSNGIRFSDCAITADAYNFDGSQGTVFDGCLFPGGNANTINNSVNGHASTTQWTASNVDLTGQFPSFIVAGQDHTLWTAPWNLAQLSYSFPTDANQALTAAQSVYGAMVIAAGTVTTTRTITHLKPAAANNAILVRNNTAQSVTFAWASGTGVTIPTNAAWIVGCDGTNAIKLGAMT